MPSFVGNVQIKLPDEAPARNPKYCEPLAKASDPPTNAVIPMPMPPSIVIAPVVVDVALVAVYIVREDAEIPAMSPPEIFLKA